MAALLRANGEAQAPASRKLIVALPKSRSSLKFINGVSLDKDEAARSRREVRSHVARISSSQNGILGETAQASGRSKARRRRPKSLKWPMTIALPEQQVQVQVQEQDQGQHQDQELEHVPGRSAVMLQPFSNHQFAMPALDSPASHLPFIPLVMQNYLDNLVIAVPELDGPNDTLLLGKSWFPMVVNSPIVFQVVALFSASHYAARHGDMSMASDILWLKHLAIKSLVHAISQSTGTSNDSIVAAAAKMASYEAIYGSEAAYHVHMNGVERMVRLRGGLTSLGLDGFLARLIHFIDTNAAFLLNCHLHFDESLLPKRMNPFLPNPSQFICES